MYQTWIAGRRELWAEHGSESEATREALGLLKGHQCEWGPECGLLGGIEVWDCGHTPPQRVVTYRRETRAHPPVNGCTMAGEHPCILTLPGPVPRIVQA